MTAFRCEWAEQHLKRDPKVVFDVGCYDGADSVDFKEYWPEARVVAFEADPEIFRNNAQRGRMRLAGVESHHAAVMDRDGEVEFHPTLSTDLTGYFGASGSVLTPNGDFSFRHPTISFKPACRVPCLRLDSFCRDHGIAAIDLLHIDAQGAELSVLNGLGDILPAIVFLEIDEVAGISVYENAVPAEELAGWFSGRGYRLAWKSQNDALYLR